MYVLRKITSKCMCQKKPKDKKLVFVLSKYDFINSVHQLSYDTRKFSFDDPNQLTISFGHHKFCHHIGNLTHSFPMHPFSTPENIRKTYFEIPPFINFS